MGFELPTWALFTTSSRMDARRPNTRNSRLQTPVPSVINRTRLNMLFLSVKTFMKPDWRSRTPRSFGISHQAEDVRKYMFELLQYAFQARPHLTSDMDAAAIWLIRPQQFTLDSLDAFSAQKFNNKDIRCFRAKILKTEAHLTRSARRLVQERNTKAAGVNIGLASPPMTATRFSPILVTSTMTDFYSTSTPANWPQNRTPQPPHRPPPSNSNHLMALQTKPPKAP
jgi:hypothetical protein